MLNNQTALMRVASAIIVVLTIIATLIVFVYDYLAGHDIPPLVYATFSTAFTTALGYLFLDKGVSLTNSPTTDILKQASAAIVATANALPSSSAPSAPSGATPGSAT